MKRKFTLLTATFLISFIAVNAQFTTGKYLLGGDLNFRNEDGKDLNYKNGFAFVNLKAGKVIQENTVFGINLSYGHSSFESQPNKSEINQYGAGIFYRKYKPLSKEFSLFGEAGLNYAYVESKIRVAVIQKVKRLVMAQHSN